MAECRGRSTCGTLSPQAGCCSQPGCPGRKSGNRMGPDTAYYMDPPYLSETRTADDVYSHEMSPAQHAELLDTIRQCRGRIMLSGYPSHLYNTRLADWTRHEFILPNQAAGGKQKRRMTEVVWCNF